MMERSIRYTLTQPMFVVLVMALYMVISAHQLDDDNEFITPHANSLVDQIRKNNYLPQHKHVPLSNDHPYTYQGSSELSNSMMGLPLNMIYNGRKRNSELSNSMMGLPLNMMDNGRKRNSELSNSMMGLPLNMIGNGRK